jgi:hypothetical protein
MNAQGSRRAVCLVVATALPLLAGCPKQRSTMNRPPEVNPPPAVERSAEARVEELGDLAQRFASTAQRLPGRTADEHRAAVRQAFADLSQILPVLYGPNPAGSQRQQLRVVESARSQLAAAPQGLAPEPTIDTGLRATRDALESLARDSYFEEARLGQTIDRLNATVSDLDTTRGVPHQQVVAEVVDLMSEIVTQMARALDERIQEPDEERARQPKQEEPKQDEPMPDEPMPDEPMPDEPKPDDAKQDEQKQDEPEAAEPMEEETTKSRPEGPTEEPKGDKPEDGATEAEDPDPQ